MIKVEKSSYWLSFSTSCKRSRIIKYNWIFFLIACLHVQQRDEPLFSNIHTAVRMYIKTGKKIECRDINLIFPQYCHTLSRRSQMSLKKRNCNISSLKWKGFFPKQSESLETFKVDMHSWPLMFKLKLSSKLLLCFHILYCHDFRW